MARPRKNIDGELVKKLASIHCTMEEIAFAVGCSVDLLERRFADTVKEGKAHGKTSLRRYMWHAATDKGNITMMIWLSKNILGYTDKVEQVTENNAPQRLIIEMEPKKTK